MSSKLAKDARENFYVFGVISTLAVSTTLLRIALKVAKERQEERPDYNHPQLFDFWLAAAYMAVLIMIRVLVTNSIFLWIGEKVVSKKYVGEEREERVSRWAVVFFKFLFFCGFTYFGYLVIRGQEFVPEVLFGATNGTVVNCFKDYPFQPEVPNLREYYLLSLAYHGHSLVFHLVSKKRNDFMEMLMHHVITVALIVFSYLINYTYGGVLIIFVHDIADIFGYAVKSSADTSSTITTLVVYLMLLGVWGYYRLYVLPFYLIKGFYQASLSLGENDHGIPYFIAMLCGLQILHVLWYFLFLKMGMAFLYTGKTEDIQNKIENKNKKIE